MSNLSVSSCEDNMVARLQFKKHIHRATRLAKVPEVPSQETLHKVSHRAESPLCAQSKRTVYTTKNGCNGLESAFLSATSIEDLSTQVTLNNVTREPTPLQAIKKHAKQVKPKTLELLPRFPTVLRSNNKTPFEYLMPPTAKEPKAATAGQAFPPRRTIKKRQ